MINLTYNDNDLLYVSKSSNFAIVDHNSPTPPCAAIAPAPPCARAARASPHRRRIPQPFGSSSAAQEVFVCPRVTRINSLTGGFYGGFVMVECWLANGRLMVD